MCKANFKHLDDLPTFEEMQRMKKMGTLDLLNLVKSKVKSAQRVVLQVTSHNAITLSVYWGLGAYDNFHQQFMPDKNFARVTEIENFIQMANEQQIINSKKVPKAPIHIDKGAGDEWTEASKSPVPPIEDLQDTLKDTKNESNA